MSEHLNGLLAPLSVGTLAPDFMLPYAPFDQAAMHKLRGNPIVLVFYPMDWEPVSREQLMLYQDYGDEFEGFGARLLGISTDHLLSHEAFARDAQIRFPLLADVQPRGACARRYGVYRDDRGVSARANFVVDRQGIVRFSKAYPDLLNPGVDDLLTTLEVLAHEK
jgi:peroxiredoxin